LPGKRPSGAFESPNARVRYEFGSKVSITTTIKEGFVVGMRALPGNPYDGHTSNRSSLKLLVQRRLVRRVAIFDSV